MDKYENWLAKIRDNYLEEMLENWAEYWALFWSPSEVMSEIEILLKKFKEDNFKNIELLETCIKELQFTNIQRDSYKNILEEVKTLLVQWVSKKIISKVIDNGIERCILDTTIHNDLLFKNKL